MFLHMFSDTPERHCPTAAAPPIAPPGPKRLGGFPESFGRFRAHGDPPRGPRRSGDAAAGWETSELPAAVFFTQIQLLELRHFASRRRLAEPGNLGPAVGAVAILGGDLYRKNAPPPRHQKMLEGRTRLTVMSEAYELGDYFEPPPVAFQEEP